MSEGDPVSRAAGMGERRVRAFTAAVRELAPAAEKLRAGETELTWRGRQSAVRIWLAEAAAWMGRVLAGRPTYSPEQFIEAVREYALRAGWEAREQCPRGVSEHHGWFAVRVANSEVNGSFALRGWRLWGNPQVGAKV